MSRRYARTALVFVAAVSAGCSSSGKPASTTTASLPTSSTSSPAVTAEQSSTTTTPRATNRTADGALAKAALLTLSDLPSGWKAQPHVATSEAALDARLAACLHVDVSLTDTDLQTHADAQDFFGPGAQEVQSGVAIFPDATLPTRWVQLYSTPTARTCLATDVGQSAHVTLKAAEVSLPSIGDGQGGVRLSDGATVNDDVFARRGRALAYMTVAGRSGVDEGALLAKVIARLSRAG
jgi:hypothetical protein